MSSTGVQWQILLEEVRRQIQSDSSLSYDKDDLEELHVEFTYACNMRCRMCDVWKRYRRDRRLPAREIDAEELIDYVQESSYLKKARRVILSGGEPFVKKDLPALVESFVKIQTEPPDIGILSNLYNERLTLERLEEIHTRCGRRNLWIGTSLDGMEEHHNRTRGRNDAFSRFLSTLSEVRKRFPWIPISVNFTLTPDNAPDLYEVYRFCMSEGLGFSYQFPVPWEDAETFTFPESVVRQIEETTHRIATEKVAQAGDLTSILPEIFYLDGNVRYHREPRRLFAACAAGCEFVTISPVGEIYFCPPLKRMTVGDLRREPFDRIWTSRRAGKLRRWIASGRCHCWLNCTVFPNVRRALLAQADTPATKEKKSPWKGWRLRA